MRIHPLAALVAGAVIALAGALLARTTDPTPAHAQEEPASPGTYAIRSSGNLSNQPSDILWVMSPGLPGDSLEDTNTGPRLLCYHLEQGRLRLLAARNIRFDLQLDQFSLPDVGEQNPGVLEVQDMLE